MGPVHRLVLAIQYGIKCSTNVHESVGLKSIFKDKNTGAIFKGKKSKIRTWALLSVLNPNQYT